MTEFLRVPFGQSAMISRPASSGQLICLIYAQHFETCLARQFLEIPKVLIEKHTQFCPLCPKQTKLISTNFSVSALVTRVGVYNEGDRQPRPHSLSSTGWGQFFSLFLHFTLSSSRFTRLTLLPRSRSPAKWQSVRLSTWVNGSSPDTWTLITLSTIKGTEKDKRRIEARIARAGPPWATVEQLLGTQRTANYHYKWACSNA